MKPWPLLLLASCSVAVAGDAADNCERYEEAQIQWLVDCKVPYVRGGTRCEDVVWFVSSSAVDDCIAQIRATPCGSTQPPNPCGGSIVTRPW